MDTFGDEQECGKSGWDEEESEQKPVLNHELSERVSPEHDLI